MGKVKSAIITALLVIAIIVAAFFATVSYPIGTVERYNSIASSISLGSDLSGNAYAVLYPDGVISAQDYLFKSDDEKADYEKVGGVYVESEKVSGDNRAQLIASVANDAEKITKRLADKGYSSYSVSVEDGITIRVSVPTNYSYAEYKGNSQTTQSSTLSVASTAITTLTVDGRFSLRTTDRTLSTRSDEYTDLTYIDSTLTATYPLTPVKDDVTEYFSSISSYVVGSTPVLSMSLTTLGRESLKTISSKVAESDVQTIYFFVGDTQMLALTCDEEIDLDTLQLSMSDAASAENIAIAMNSAVNGEALSLTYELGDVFTSVADAGDNAALFAFIASIVVLVLAIVALIVIYKKLGIVVGLMSLVYALVIIYALYLLEIEFTLFALVMAFVGLLLFITSNAVVFEEVRRQAKTGKTIQSSVKTAYKRTVLTILEMHLIILVACIITLFVAVGEVAACGYIMFIATLASYILYWLTRLFWYVMSAPAKDKFAFGGFKREVFGDD